MTTRTATKPWDFSHVLDLVNSLSSKDLTASDRQYEDRANTLPTGTKPNGHTLGGDIATRDFGTPPSKLGDFGRVWQFLGTPAQADSPVLEVPPLTSESAVGVSDLPSKIDYTSDGAMYMKPGTKSGKAVSWHKPEVSAEEPVTDTATDRSASPETPTLTKSQRKKQRRRERKAQEAAEALKNATVSESEADSVARRKTPARKASAHVLAAQRNTPQALPLKHVNEVPALSTPAASPRHDPRSQDASGSAATVALQPSVELATSRVAEKLAEFRATPSKPTSNKQPPRPNQLAPQIRQRSHPAMQPATDPVQSSYDALRGQSDQTKQWPVTPSKAKAMPTQFVPSTVQPPTQSAAISITNNHSAHNQQNPVQIQNTSPSKPKYTIEPKIVRSGEDRHWALLMKLIGDFWEDRKYIISPMNLTTHNNDPKGIHVFVDASNIFIGFTEELKRSRGIPRQVQVPQVDLSFDALGLLMERRRPVAKRVLVGSTPHLPAFDKAKAVGYECSILEKVYKARELTERQIFFQDHDRAGRPLRHRSGAKVPSASAVAASNGSPPNSGNGNTSGNGSGSETGSTPQFAKARMIEQGVDEILHLKMLESIVDSELPSTIVLATGDAAQAEYSPGFMAMVERALKKGWKVELVSWSYNISGMYTKREWAETWGDRFRIVFLDDYAEELLEM